MAWCPQCGAEYREGVETCAGCGVRLVGERPVATGGAPPAVLLWLRKQLADAFRYAAAGVRLVRRHPGLLLLPVLVAVFNGVEMRAGYYVMYRHTAYGRAAVESWRSLGRKEVTADILTRPRPLRVRDSAAIFSNPFPTPRLGGTSLTLYAAMYGDPGKRSSRPYWATLPYWLTWLVGLPLFGLLAGGYYAMAAEVAAGGELRWGGFATHARRYFLRLALYSLVVGVVLYVLPDMVMNTALAAPRDADLQWVARLCSGWLEWVVPLVSFLLPLTVVAIVVDDVSVTEGMSRSVATVVRRLATAAVVLAFVIVPGVVVQVLLNSLDATLTKRALGGDVAVLALWQMPGGVARNVVAAVLGTWMCMALLLWYGEVSQRWWPATAGAADERR